MKIVGSAAKSPSEHEAHASAETPAALSTGIFHPIRGLDPDMGPRAIRGNGLTPWWSRLRPGRRLPNQAR